MVIHSDIADRSWSACRSGGRRPRTCTAPDRIGSCLRLRRLGGQNYVREFAQGDRRAWQGGEAGATYLEFEQPHSWNIGTPHFGREVSQVSKLYISENGRHLRSTAKLYAGAFGQVGYGLGWVAFSRAHFVAPL